MPIPGDAVPELVAVGVGDPAELDAAALRDAAAAFARATYRHARIAGRAAVARGRRRRGRPGRDEGILLARYRYRGFRDQPGEAILEHVTLVADGASATRSARAPRAGARPPAPCTSPATSPTPRRCT